MPPDGFELVNRYGYQDATDSSTINGVSWTITNEYRIPGYWHPTFPEDQSYEEFDEAEKQRKRIELLKKLREAMGYVRTPERGRLLAIKSLPVPARKKRMNSQRFGPRLNPRRNNRIR